MLRRRRKGEGTKIRSGDVVRVRKEKTSPESDTLFSIFSHKKLAGISWICEPAKKKLVIASGYSALRCSCFCFLHLSVKCDVTVTISIFVRLENIIVLV